MCVSENSDSILGEYLLLFWKHIAVHMTYMILMVNWNTAAIVSTLSMFYIAEFNLTSTLWTYPRIIIMMT